MSGTAARQLPAAPKFNETLRSIAAYLTRPDVRAIGAVLPLALVLIALYLVPVTSFLSKSVYDRSIADAFPATASVLEHWTGNALPGDVAFAALVIDLKAKNAAARIGEAAARLERAEPGVTALLNQTRRRLALIAGPGDRDTLIALDARWGDLLIWHLLKDAATPWTGDNIKQAIGWPSQLGAIQAKAGANGAAATATGLAPLARTIAITALASLAALLIAAPLAVWLRWQEPRRRYGACAVLLAAACLPSLAAHAGWLVLTGPQTGTVGGTALPLTLFHLPAAILLCAVFIRTSPPAAVLQARSLGAKAGTILRRLELPANAGACLAAGVCLWALMAGGYLGGGILHATEANMIGVVISGLTRAVPGSGLAAAHSLLWLAALGLIAGAAVALINRRLPSRAPAQPAEPAWPRLTGGLAGSGFNHAAKIAAALSLGLIALPYAALGLAAIALPLSAASSAWQQTWLLAFGTSIANAALAAAAATALGALAYHGLRQTALPLRRAWLGLLTLPALTPALVVGPALATWAGSASAQSNTVLLAGHVALAAPLVVLALYVLDRTSPQRLFRFGPPLAAVLAFLFVFNDSVLPLHLGPFEDRNLMRQATLAVHSGAFYGMPAFLFMVSVPLAAAGLLMKLGRLHHKHGRAERAGEPQL